MIEQTLKSSWQQVKFGEVVRLSKVRSSDPLADGFDRYIGLEHIDPEDLRISRWGNVADGVTFTSVFKPGQVLFGKRRAYQRKVAVADFSGVCSGDIYVFESKDSKKLLPALLPFICQTEEFLQYAVGTSAGSLSPRTNWTSLANFEFSLPPAEEQRRIADLLIEIENTSNEYDKLKKQASQLSCAFLGNVLMQKSPIVSLGAAVLNTQYGLSINPNDQGQYPILRMMNLENGLCVENDIKYVDLSSKDFESYKLIVGDVLFNRTNSYELVGRTGVYSLQGEHVFASYLVRIKTDPAKLEPKYLTLFLNSDYGRRQVLSFATKGVSQANVNASNLLKVQIPLPSLDVQKELLTQIEQTNMVSNATVTRRAVIAQMKQLLLARLAGS